MRQRRKLVIYRTLGELDYFEYFYDNILKNEKQVNSFLNAHPNYEYGSVQVVRNGPRARWIEYCTELRSKSMSISEILQMCKENKLQREDKPVVLKPESEYLYNRETAEGWVKVAQENNWDLNESIKPLCEHLGLSLVVVAPVLLRYEFITKRKPAEKVYKYSKEQVQVWWNDKLRDGLTIKQIAEKVGVHFLQLGRAFTQYGHQPKKVKLSKAEKKELRNEKKLAKKK